MIGRDPTYKPAAASKWTGSARTATAMAAAAGGVTVVDRDADAGPDPLIWEANVIGLYRPDVAALASRATFCGKPWPGWVDD